MQVTYSMFRDVCSTLCREGHVATRSFALMISERLFYQQPNPCPCSKAEDMPLKVWIYGPIHHNDNMERRS